MLSFGDALGTSAAMLPKQAITEDQHHHQAYQPLPGKPYVSQSDLELIKSAGQLVPVSETAQPLGLQAKFMASVMVVAWFTSNIGLLVMNRYLLSNYGFKQPVFLTLCHMLACVVFSTALNAAEFVPKKSISSSRQLVKICVLAVVFAMSVVSGNVALKFIPVSFSQAIGATTPAFTAALSLVMLRNREMCRTYAALMPVVVGVVIATRAEMSFNMAGFISALMATAGRAFKSVLQGMLLADPAEKMDPMSLLRYMAPISIVVLLPATLVLEPGVIEQTLQRRTDIQFAAFLVTNSALAYFVNLTNFLVTQYTSALTLQVLGNGKGVAAALISVMLFRNPVSISGVVGYLITVLGVMLYMQTKRKAVVAKVPSPQANSAATAV